LATVIIAASAAQVEAVVAVEAVGMVSAWAGPVRSFGGASLRGFDATLGSSLGSPQPFEAPTMASITVNLDGRAFADPRADEAEKHTTHDDGRRRSRSERAHPP
jgi:hypothetical protein